MGNLEENMVQHMAVGAVVVDVINAKPVGSVDGLEGTTQIIPLTFIVGKSLVLTVAKAVRKRQPHIEKAERAKVHQKPLAPAIKVEVHAN